MSRYRDITFTIVRWALGALFIFSGVVKCVDPIGTSIFVDKYLATYSMGWLMPISESLAVGLSVFEFTLGVLLVSDVWRRFTALITVVVLLLFSVVTLLSATILPIGDCGCFGDALKLSPWATFLKNIVMLPFAIALWRISDRCHSVKLRDFIIFAVAISLPLLVNIYALKHLPLVDFLPYKVGTNIREAIAKEQSATRQVLRFRHTTTGEVVEFDAMDTSCWTDSNLEFVESAMVTEEGVEFQYGDFHLYNIYGEDVTSAILNHSGRIALLCVNDATNIDASTIQGIAKLYNAYPAETIYILSSETLDVEELSLQSTHLYIDAMTLRSILRADVGVVILSDGVVEFKSAIKDI